MNSQDVTITKHREPPPGFDPDSGFGYIRAEGGGAAVSAPVTLNLLDDPVAVEQYVNNRLLQFHQIELDRIHADEATQ